jgi:hypothetical protein
VLQRRKEMTMPVERRYVDDPDYDGPERRLELITAAQVADLRVAVSSLAERVTVLTDQVADVGELHRRQQAIDELAAHAEREAEAALAKLADVETTIVSREELARTATADRAERDRVRARLARLIFRVAFSTLVVGFLLGALLIVALVRQSHDNTRLAAQTHTFATACAARNVQLAVQRQLYVDQNATYTAHPNDPLAVQLGQAARAALAKLPPAQDCTP